MYTVQVKINKAPNINGEDFLIYTVRGINGFNPLTKEEADIVLTICNNNPNLFQEAFIREYEEEDVTLLNIGDEEKYSYALTCDFSHLYYDLAEEDQARLDNIAGRCQGFSQKYISLNI